MTAIGSSTAPSMDRITEILAAHTVRHVGVTDASVLEPTRRILHERKADGLHDGMQFTYRNPDRSTEPQRSVPGAVSVIAAARSYAGGDPGAPADTVAARVGRYSWIDWYEPLRVALRDVAGELEAAGETARVHVDDNAIVDRAVAVRAGLGWFGKNANVLLPGAGSFFVLGCIVTTAHYEPSVRNAPDGCGTCTTCLDDCPTGAIVEPGVIDAARCLSWVLQKPGPIDPEFRTAIGDRIYGCDDCQDTCPVTVRLGDRHVTGELSAADRRGEEIQSHVDVLELLDSDDATIERRHGRWWIAGREMRWLRRNALVVLGNVGDPGDARVHAMLERYRDDPDDILAEHAGWASERLAGRRRDAVR